MKKLVSLLSAAAMMTMLAVPASAALTYAPDEDGWYVIEEIPTDAEVAAYAPTLSATATKLETEENLKAISSAVNKKYKSKLASHDIYKITYDMAELGTFVNAYDENYNNAFFGLYDITIGFDSAALPEGFETYALTYTLPDGATGATGLGVDEVTGILNAAYTAPGVAYDKIFPARTNDEGIVVDAGTYKAEYILAYPKTTDVVTLPYAGAKVTYQKGVTNAATTNITCDDIVLGAVEEPEEPTNTITVSKVISDKVGDAVRENMITWGLAAVCDVDGAPTAKTITFNITAKDAVNGENTKPFTYDLGVEDWSKIDAPFVFGLNIKGVPAEGATITCDVADVTIQ